MSKIDTPLLGDHSPAEIRHTFLQWNDIQHDGFRLRPHILARVENQVAYVIVPRNAHQSTEIFMRPFVIMPACYLGGYTVFTIIRNPITRFVSAYLMINDALGYTEPGIGPLVRSFPYWKIDDPAERVVQYIKDIARYGLYDPHIMTQSYYLDVGVQIDEYIIFEKLSFEMEDFAFRHNLQGEFPTTNPTRFPELNGVLREVVVKDSECLNILSDLYRDDFEMYKAKTGVDPAKGEYDDGDWTLERKAELWRMAKAGLIKAPRETYPR